MVFFTNPLVPFQTHSSGKKINNMCYMTSKIFWHPGCKLFPIEQKIPRKIFHSSVKALGFWW